MLGYGVALVSHDSKTLLLGICDLYLVYALGKDMVGPLGLGVWVRLEVRIDFAEALRNRAVHSLE